MTQTNMLPPEDPPWAKSDEPLDPGTTDGQAERLAGTPTEDALARLESLPVRKTASPSVEAALQSAKKALPDGDMRRIVVGVVVEQKGEIRDLKVRLDSEQLARVEAEKRLATVEERLKNVQGANRVREFVIGIGGAIFGSGFGLLFQETTRLQGGLVALGGGAFLWVGYQLMRRDR